MFSCSIVTLGQFDGFMGRGGGEHDDYVMSGQHAVDVEFRSKKFACGVKVAIKK